MNGPQHYAAAENALDVVAKGAVTDETDRVAIIAIAQVHATLALVAAQVGFRDVMQMDMREEWRRVAR